MKKVGSWWFPKSEQHMRQFIQADDTYQQRQRNKALSYVKNFDVAIDIGGHVGLWSRDFAKKFKTLHAFEPMNEMLECFRKNVIEWPETTADVHLYPVALGAHDGRVAMAYENDNTGHSHVELHVDGDYVMTTLDSFNFPVVDYIKIDAEGFEEYILKGAVETLQRCKPVVTIEKKRHTFYLDEADYGGYEGASDFLLTQNMRLLGVEGADFNYGW
jgi:FkbM family methyltransferase